MLGTIARNIVGPTAVMAAGTMGAGAVASLLLSGAWFRYELLWVVLLMLPVFVISVDSSSRIGALNPDSGMFALINRRIHPMVGWLLLLINVPVHLLIGMGQLSVMSSSLLSLLTPSGSAVPALGRLGESCLALGIGGAVIWLVFSQGYERMQRVMTWLLMIMFFCFLVVAVRGFSEWRAILAGFVPHIPPDLTVPGTDGIRSATGSILAIAGSAIAPAALLGMPYLSSDAGVGESELWHMLRRAIVNLGFIFGAYAILVIIAGGFALYSLPDHAQFSDVGQARLVMQSIFPQQLSFLGPVIFTLGMLVAALTTLVVVVQVSTYFILDTFGSPWAFSRNNRLYHGVAVGFILTAALLAPHWSFPAMLKVLLLMGVNLLVIPVVFLIVIYFMNNRDLMGQHRATWWRNAILFAGFALSLLLAVHKTPDYVVMLGR